MARKNDITLARQVEQQTEIMAKRLIHIDREIMWERKPCSSCGATWGTRLMAHEFQHNDGCWYWDDLIWYTAQFEDATFHRTQGDWREYMLGQRAELIRRNGRHVKRLVEQIRARMRETRTLQANLLPRKDITQASTTNRTTAVDIS